MMTWLRSNIYASGILVLLRLYLGFQWLMSGIGKITNGFDASGFMGFIVQKPVTGPDGSVAYPLYIKFIESIALPNAEIFNVLVPLGEVLIGLGLMVGTLTTAAAFFGLMMNFIFVLGGTVATNPTFILIGFIILAAGANAGRFGGDYWVIPWIRKSIFKKKDSQSEIQNLTA